MKLRFTARATHNLIEIADYLQERNPAAARSVRAAIYEALQSILLFHDIGRPQKLEGVRKLVTRQYAYLIYYTVDASSEEIVVLTVKHPARERDFEDA
ncbi:MAG: type II toxin-antitoxin system RelE/ParE family toxin [Pseudolabrys sp.]